MRVLPVLEVTELIADIRTMGQDNMLQLVEMMMG